MRKHLNKLLTVGPALGALCLAPGLRTADAAWGSIEIPVDAQPGPNLLRNIDTMVLPDGTPAVGFADQGVTPTIAFAEPGGVRTISYGPNVFTGPTRFEVDPFGIISYAKSQSTGGPLYGTDYGQRTELFHEVNLPLSEQRTWPTTDIALDSRGIPTLVAMTPSFPSYMVSTFDIPSASWSLRNIGSSLPGQLARDVVATYTPDDRLVLSSQDQLGNYELLIEQPGSPFYAITVSAGFEPGAPYHFGSIATYGNEVAFMFAAPDESGIRVGIFDGTLTIFESVPSPQDNLAGAEFTGIAPGSLAYAPDGTLSLVYIEEQTGVVVFAERSSPNDWDLEVVSEGEDLLASLAFAADGTPYVGVADVDGIDLYSPAYNPIPGDANGDGQVTAADLVILDANFGQAGTFADGDFNGDGVITAADLVILDANFGAGVGSATNASGVAAIPEPSSLALLGLAGLLHSRRRR